MILLLPGCASTPATESTVRYAVQGKYADVHEDIVQAVTNRGMVISAEFHISDMLNRTGKDVGSDKKIYRHAQVILFCSAVISRKAMEVDAHNTVFCPYGIAVYELQNEPGKIFVSYRKAPEVNNAQSRAAMDDVEKLLDGIARDATGK
ncbi:MAG: DUF302 domain-containing protein [Burkholderiales bacterium]